MSASLYFANVVVPFRGDECLIWPFRRNNMGYGQLKRDRKSQLVSRLVCVETHGLPPSIQHHAAHVCGNGHLGCVNPRHLIWKSPAENQADKIIHGTSNRGNKHWAAKLSEDDVRNVRQLVMTHSQAYVADMFSVSRPTINAILKGRSWSWLSDEDHPNV